MKVKQPRVGYIDPKTLEIAFSDDDGGDADVLEPVENIGRDLVTVVVTCMTVVKLGTPKEEAFRIPSLDFSIRRKARDLMHGIRGLDDDSIVNAVKLSGFVIGRGEPVEMINPDAITIRNVRTMIERLFRFFKDMERVASASPWLFKTSAVRPTKDDIHELLMDPSLQRCLGIYNPRLNEVYWVRVDAIPDDGYTKRAPGCSVTRRIQQIKQPRGGYINPRTLEVVSLCEGADALNPEENVSPGLIGITVDYMTRFMLGTLVEEAFTVSLKGAHLVGLDVEAEFLMEDVKGLDDESIISAVKLAGFDVCLRAGVMHYRSFEGINPDEATIQNVRAMVERALRFFDEYGPMVLNGFTFEGGYTDTVSSGDGDFTTADTLWDFKVSKARPTKNHTLQLFMYWRMGLHSVHTEFQDIRYLGIYNPRLNEVYRISVDDIPDDVIVEVERDVIGYPE